MNDILVCPNCNSKNRVGQVPSGRVPVCAKCQQALPWLHNGSDQSFASDLEAGVPVLVDFWAPWCGPCRMVAPVLEELAREHAGKLRIVKINVDENPQVSQNFSVRSIPTLMLFQNGRPVDTMVGALPKGQLNARLSPHLKPSSI